MTRHIRINQSVLKHIKALSEAAFPEEACGLLISRKQQPDHLIRQVQASNVHAKPDRFFEMDPVVLLRTHREVRASDEYIAGVWHSHPSGTSIPSETDRLMALDPAYIWLIVGVGDQTSLGLFQAPAHQDDSFTRLTFDCI